MGGNAFSSTECAHAFFFGGEEEPDDAESEVPGFDEDGE